MTNRGVLLKLLMDKLGVDPQLGTFRNRLVLQKSVYLLQALGMPTAFGYNWYLRGPYSPALTAAAFEEVVKPLEQGDDTPSGYTLSRETEDRLDKLQGMKDQADKAGLAPEKWLELLASIHFYKHKMYFPPEKQVDKNNAEALYGHMPPAKRHAFTAKQAEQAAAALNAADAW